MLCLWNPRPWCWNKARPLPSWCFIAPSYVCFTLWRRRNSRWHGFSSLRRASRSTRGDRIGATSHPAKYKSVTAIVCGVPAAAVTMNTGRSDSPAGDQLMNRQRRGSCHSHPHCFFWFHFQVLS